MAKTVASTKKPQTRRPWSKDDLRLLKRMARKEPVAKIAKALRRTTGATRHKGTIMGVSLSMKPKKGVVKAIAARPHLTRKIAIHQCSHAMRARHSPSAAARRCL